MVEEGDIADVAAAWTGQFPDAGSAPRAPELLELEKTGWRSGVIGQPEAVARRVRIPIRRPGPACRIPRRPVVPPLSRPTGVGKTELAKALPAALVR